MLEWLIGAGVGPAAVSVPVNWTADALASTAQRWFRRVRRTDDLSRLVSAAAGGSTDLSDAEFRAVRQLLEDRETWNVAGRGTVGDLADRISSCLLPRGSRTSEDSYVAAITIARGFLEFSVADLDPKLFQRLLLTRLQRMEAAQADALDEVMLSLHGDLIVRFSDVMGQFKRVLDRLQPGPAGRGEVAVYLKTLINWLNADAWPRDRRFGGPTLIPDAVERKLRLKNSDVSGEQVLEADEVSRKCTRLVVLGGPGSGKTWLARRTARRCAQEALDLLAAGKSLDEVELPLYTTCSRLFSAMGDIREAVVSSALDQCGDLGGSRVSAALRVLFTERNAPTLLVIDSLDEARGAQERLRQADTLPWRIILMTRASSWNHQLQIDQGDGAHQVGELLPLRYPDDVEPFIQRWFAQQPERGRDLAAQIAQSCDLRRDATVPLLLTFYCIVGGGTLPGFRRDLYARVIRRLLTGRWRKYDDREVDVSSCLHTLRAWAWTSATSHPVSGIGAWADELATVGESWSEAASEALDHVAPALELSDIDTGTTPRRFIHRSVQEHLVAEYVAGLPGSQAAEILLPHIWYDLDWEYSAPAALAMHPERDRILRDLIRRATGVDQIPEDLSVLDAGWEFRRFLIRAAAETNEGDWSPGVAEVIGRARLDLARSGHHIGELHETRQWGSSNSEVCTVLLGRLPGQTSSLDAERLVSAAAQLAQSAGDKRQVRETLLGLLVSQPAQSAGWVFKTLMDGMTLLDPTTGEKHQICDVLLEVIRARNFAAQELVSGLARLDPAAEDKRRVCDALYEWLRQARGTGPVVLTHSLMQLDPTSENRQQARDVLLGLLADTRNSEWAKDLTGAVVDLAATDEDIRQTREAIVGLMTSHSNPPPPRIKSAHVAGYGSNRSRTAESEIASAVAGGLAQLDPRAEERAQARAALLTLLGSQSGHWEMRKLADGMVKIAVTEDDKSQLRTSLLALLGSSNDYLCAEALGTRLIQLDPTAEEQRQARTVLLKLLASASRAKKCWVAAALAGALANLDPTDEEQQHARETLLQTLSSQVDYSAAENLFTSFVQLVPAADDMPTARRALLALLPDQTNGSVTAALAGALANLDPTSDDQHHARKTIRRLLTDQTDGWVAAALARALATLDPTSDDQHHAREILLQLLSSESHKRKIEPVITCIFSLAMTAEDKHQARMALLKLLARQTDGWVAAAFARGLLQFGLSAEERCHACEVLLILLTSETDTFAAEELVSAVVELALTEDDKRRAIETILLRLSEETPSSAAEELTYGAIRLGLTVNDLGPWHNRRAPLAVGLLPAARRNSELSDWLQALPALTALSN